MLKQRFLTAVILIPLVLLGIYRLPDTGYMLVALGIVLIGAWEWARLSGVKLPLLQAGYATINAVLIFTNFMGISQWLTVIAPGWWLGGLLLLMYFNRHQVNKPNKTMTVALMLIGIAVLVSLWLNLVTLRTLGDSPRYLLYLLTLIWGADIAAYFSGKYFGQHKLAPLISPNKTWEGVAGALVGTTILTLLYAVCFQLAPLEAGYWAFLSFITVVFSIVGDLFESLLKRSQNMKDSGQLLPGHGGMLDRIDSLLAAAPIFTIGVIYQPIILEQLRVWL